MRLSRRALLSSAVAAGLASTLPPARAAQAIPAALQRLANAYPLQLAGAAPNALLWRDGTRMAWDDGAGPRTFDEILDRADLKDQMSMAYVSGTGAVAAPGKDHDPGRIRCAAFFEKMYGRTAAEVTGALRPVAWPAAGANATFPMTSINGVHLLLEDIGREIAELPEEIRRFARNPGGSFNWRDVAGTSRKSGHAFGIAFDLDAGLAGYWRWDRRPRWRNTVPLQLVEIFERRKFIWGGKWFHYDTMHFEYRPEMF